jgi:hypothetical protein
VTDAWIRVFMISFAWNQRWNLGYHCWWKVDQKNGAKYPLIINIKFYCCFILHLTNASCQIPKDKSLHHSKCLLIMTFQLYRLKRQEAKTKNKYMKNKNFRKLKYVPGNPQNAGFCTIYPTASGPDLRPNFFRLASVSILHLLFQNSLLLNTCTSSYMYVQYLG